MRLQMEIQGRWGGVLQGHLSTVSEPPKEYSTKHDPLCYKTPSLQRPAPQPPNSVLHHTQSTSATRPPLYTDQSLNLPIVYSTTHEAPLLQDLLSRETSP